MITMGSMMKNVNGIELNTTIHNEDGGASIIIVHGYAEYGQRYHEFVQALIQEDYRVMTYDHRGHGKSKGDEATISSFDLYVEDLHEQVQSFFRPEDSNFIYGHSMGALVTLRYLQRYGSEILNGVVLSGAALKMYKEPRQILITAVTLISKILPNFPAVPVDASTVSRDQKVVDAYIADPLIYTKPTKAKLAYEFHHAQQKAKKELHKITVPILLNHGTEDHLIHPDSTQMTYDQISSEDKTMLMWEGLYHEILNEPEKEDVAAEMIKWMNARN